MKPDISFVTQNGHFYLLTTLLGSRLISRSTGFRAHVLDERKGNSSTRRTQERQTFAYCLTNSTFSCLLVRRNGVCIVSLAKFVQMLR